jgi:hypothetical protein
MDPYTVDSNTIKWCGFFKTEELAQKSLDDKVVMFAKKKNILSVKKELQIRKPSNELLHKLNELNEARKSVTDGMLLYKFTIVLSPKVKSASE